MGHALSAPPMPQRASQAPHSQGQPLPSPSQLPQPPSVGQQLPPQSQVPQSQMTSRAMEATALVRPPPAPQSSSKGGLFIGLGIVFLGLVAAALVFMLMPRTGKIVVNVADGKGTVIDHVEVFVDGKKQCDTVPCIVDQVTTGDHQVKILGGFEAVAPRTVAVESQKSATVDFSLVGSAKGTGVKIASRQAGVKLYIDNKEIGPVPQEVKDLSPGDHTIRLAGSDRHKPYETKVSIGKDEMQDLGNMQLAVAKGKATIQLATPGARVFIVSGADRRELPTLPISVEIDTAKTWFLEASKLGFNDFKTPISFEDGQAEKTFTVSLDPKGTAPAATVAAPAATAVATVTPTVRPTATAAAPTATAASPTATAASPTATAASTGAAATGEAFLNINSIPASNVVLDGKPLGQTPQMKIKVTPGSHTVLFINAELSLKKSISVTVGAGETKPAIAKLRD
jgi:serine/threonine-protein kinase